MTRSRALLQRTTIFRFACMSAAAAVLTDLSHGYNTYSLALKPDVDFATTGNIIVDWIASAASIYAVTMLISPRRSSRSRRKEEEEYSNGASRRVPASSGREEARDSTLGRGEWLPPICGMKE